MICPEKAIGAPKGSEHLGGRTSFFSSHQAKVTEIELAAFIVAHMTFSWGDFEILKVKCAPLFIRTYTLIE